MQVTLRHETLYRIDSHRLIQCGAGTGILAAPVADPAADRRKRIILLDQGQRLFVTAFLRQLQISLHCDMGRASRLTGCRTSIVTVDSVHVTVIMGPHMFAPLLFLWKGHLRISNLTAIFLTQLLPQFHGARRAGFHTFAAGNTFLLIHLRNISRTGHVRCIKQLGSAERIAHIHVAVAYGKNLVSPVYIGNLVDETILFRLSENIQRLFLRDIPSVLLGLHHVIRHITHCYAPAFRIISAAFVMVQT